jgi:hypothetical protein
VVPPAATEPYVVSPQYNGSSVPFALGIAGVGTANRWGYGAYFGSWTFVNDTTAIVPGKTYFLVGSHSSLGEMRLYVDGLRVATTAAPDTQQYWGGNDIRVGRRWDNSGTYRTASKIAGVAVFYKQLTDAQVLSLFQAGGMSAPPPTRTRPGRPAEIYKRLGSRIRSIT